MFEVAVSVPMVPAATPPASAVTEASRPPPDPVVDVRRVTLPGVVQARVVLALSAQYRSTVDPLVATVAAGAEWEVLAVVPCTAETMALIGAAPLYATAVRLAFAVVDNGTRTVERASAAEATDGSSGTTFGGAAAPELAEGVRAEGPQCARRCCRVGRLFREADGHEGGEYHPGRTRPCEETHQPPVLHLMPVPSTSCQVKVRPKWLCGNTAPFLS
jgi:hypothetical protein